MFLPFLLHAESWVALASKLSQAVSLLSSTLGGLHTQPPFLCAAIQQGTATRLELNETAELEDKRTEAPTAGKSRSSGRSTHQPAVLRCIACYCSKHPYVLVVTAK